MLTGASLVPFRARDAELVVVPYAGGDLLAGADDAIDAYPGLAEWWRKAEQVWIANRTASSKMRLNDRIDFQRLRRKPGGGC